MQEKMIEENNSYYSPLIKVGDVEKYTAHCRRHHIVVTIHRELAKYLIV
jgi:thymidine kinase